MNYRGDFLFRLLSIFREVLCNGLDHSNCLSCQHVFSYVWDNFNKSYSHRDITRSIKLNFPSSKKLQIGDEEKTRIFCGIGFQTDNKTSCKPSDIAGRILCCFELWKQARDNEVKVNQKNFGYADFKVNKKLTLINKTITESNLLICSGNQGGVKLTQMIVSSRWLHVSLSFIFWAEIYRNKLKNDILKDLNSHWWYIW